MKANYLIQQVAQRPIKLKIILLLSCLTLSSLIPQYLSRMNLDVAFWFYNHFSTYFGDLWYCWNNYLSKGFNYPVEYPAGMQLLFELIAKIPDIKENYTFYTLIISSLIASAGLACSLLLYLAAGKPSQIIRYWIFAPSFLFYALYNVDLIPILCIILSYYLQQQQKPSAAILSLAIGTAIKVFPIFLLAIYLLTNPPKQRLKLMLVFVLAWLTCNLNIMLTDWARWIYPYLWQIQENFAKNNHDASWTWLVYVLFDHFGMGSWSGKVSLLLFASGYYLILRKYSQWSLIRKLTAVMILFLLTDRIYSPQYNLYLLPCLALLDYKVNWRYFYLLEIPNFCQGLFLFAIKNQPWLLQSLISVKYLALILLLNELMRKPHVTAVELK